MLHKDNNRKCSDRKIKLLVVGLKGLSPRQTDWLQTASRKVTVTENPTLIIVCCRVTHMAEVYQIMKSLLMSISSSGIHSS
jgi:hypothetical protein